MLSYLVYSQYKKKFHFRININYQKILKKTEFKASIFYWSVERKMLTHKGGTLNIGTMTGRGRELADMME